MAGAEQRVAVVTGASRGAGRGIAEALVGRGWQVYTTGRTVVAENGTVAVPLDHRDDDAVAALFERIRNDTGRLDLLVNNAAAIHDKLTSRKPFWQKPIELADVLDVGLRSAYVASYYAAPLMIDDGGVIAFTSSPGSVCYMHGPPCESLRRKAMRWLSTGSNGWTRSTRRTAGRWSPPCTLQRRSS